MGVAAKKTFNCRTPITSAIDSAYSQRLDLDISTRLGIPYLLQRPSRKYVRRLAALLLRFRMEVAPPAAGSALLTLMVWWSAVRVSPARALPSHCQIERARTYVR